MVEDRGTKHFLGKPMSNNHGRSFELNHPHYLNHGLLPPPIFKHRKHCESYKSTSTSTHRRTSSQPMQQQHHSHHSLHHAYSSHHQPPPHFKSQHHKNAAHHSQPPQQTVVPHRSMPSSRISTAEHDSPASFANANAISSVASTSYPCTLPNSTTLSHQSDLLSRSDSLTSSIDSSNATSGIQIRTDDKRTPSSSLSLSTSSSSLSLLSASQIPPKQGVVYHEQRYKTELCRAYEEQRNCVYGDRCMFAHGQWELKRNVHRHPKYKTQKCVAFEQQGLCQFGPRCAFLHEKPYTLERLVEQVQQLSRLPMPENPQSSSGNRVAVPASAAIDHLPITITESVATQIVNSSSFGIPYQANGTPIDKTDLLPDVSTLLLDDQANTTAIVFAENSVIARRLPVFRQLCSNEHTLDEDHHWLDDSVTTSLIWTLSSSASIDNSTNIWTALSTNSSFTAPLSNGSQPTSSNTSSTSLDHSLN